MTDNTELTSVESEADPAAPVTVEQLEAALGGGTTDTSKAEPEAPAEQPKEEAKAEGERPAEEEAADPEEQPKPKKGYFAKRIEEMTWRQREAERERDAARQELEALKADRVKASTGVDPTAPNPQDATKYPLGEFDQKFIADMAQHAALQAVRAERQRVEAERTHAERVQRREAFEAKITEKDEGAYRLLNDPEMPVTEAMVEVISSSALGVRVADHLGRNPDECARIAKLSPTRQAYELGRLEARLMAPPPVSKAPAPVPTVGTRAQTQKRPEDMTQREFNEWWDAKEAAKRKSA